MDIYTGIVIEKEGIKNQFGAQMFRITFTDYGIFCIRLLKVGCSNSFIPYENIQSIEKLEDDIITDEEREEQDGNAEPEYQRALEIQATIEDKLHEMRKNSKLLK